MVILNMVMFYIMTFGTILITLGLFPKISRRNLLFGVTIPACAQDDPEVIKIKKEYTCSIYLTGAVLTILYIAGYLLLDEAGFTLCMVASIIALILDVSIIYYKSWRKAGELKEQKGWDKSAQAKVIADTSFSQYKISVSPLWLLVYPLIIAATLITGYLLYDKIPAQVPMQMDFDGNITRYAEKSIRLLYFAPAVQAVMALIFSYIFYVIRSSRPELDPENPEISAKQNALFRRRWSAFMVFGGILMMLLFMSIQLAITALLSMTASFYLTMAMTLLLVAGVTILAITTGQSGSRIRLKKVQDGKVINRSDDKHWKLGMFYFNPDDPALFVEKRFGVGFTSNFGRPLSWIILLGIIGIILAISLISAKLAV